VSNVSSGYGSASSMALAGMHIQQPSVSLFVCYLFNKSVSALVETGRNVRWSRPVLTLVSQFEYMGC